MFYNCKNLQFLNLSSFNTEQVKRFENIFDNCLELTSLDLSNFNTDNAINMENMFRNCIKLTYLDISHFNTLSVNNMSSMFYGCFNLEYLNIKNFEEKKDSDTNKIFEGTPDNIIYCIKNEEMTPKIKIILDEKECKINDCDENWKENYENMIEIKKTNINVINDVCIIKKIKKIAEDFYFSNKTMLAVGRGRVYKSD